MPGAREPPIDYLGRIRRYYLALGYRTPYRWAHYESVPFTALARPLAQARVALVTTAARFRAGLGEQGPGAPYNARAKFYTVYSAPADGPHDLRISHLTYDRDHAPASDANAYFPLPALRRAAAEGRIGEVAARFHGVPTNRSQRTTLERDCPALLERLREDGAHAAVLVPNCPVCHQTLSLAARHLEAHGIATVVMGSAKDVVEHVGVPRLAFSDFPLGNAAGRPHSRDSQEATLALALALLRDAGGARTTVCSLERWAENDAWKRDFCRVDGLSAEELAQRRAAFDTGKSAARARREAEGLSVATHPPAT